MKQLFFALGVWVTLLAGFAQQPSLEQLRQNVAELEARWNDYPALRGTVAPDLRAARLTLVGRLQKDLAYFSSKNPGTDKATKQLLDQIAQEITQQNAQLVSEATQSGSASGGGTPLKESLKTNEKSQPAKPEPQPPDPNPKAEDVLATPISDVQMSFAYQIGVSLIRGKGFQGGCTIGSGAITSDAAIWDVTVTLVAKQMPAFQTAGPFAQTNGKGLLVVPLITMDQNTQLLLSGRKAYIGRAEQNVLAPKFHFRNLSLNEVTDLLQSLKANQTRVETAFGGAAPKITVYQILAPVSAGAFVSSYFNAVEERLLDNTEVNSTNLAGKLNANAGKDLVVTVDGANTKVHIAPLITLTFSPPQLVGDSVDELTKFASDLANLGTSGHLDFTKPKGSQLTATPADKPFVIENECFQISFTPGLQNGGVAPAGSFRGRISYVPDKIPLTLKLSASGEGSNDRTKPNRIAGSGDFTYLARPFAHGWYATVGATGDYSYSQLAGVGMNEWRGGGKFELQTPVQNFFPVRSGSDQKPTLTIETGGIGGSTFHTKTSFVVRGDFIYSLQPSAKLFLDLQAAAGHSDDTRFNGRRDFSFGSFGGRFAIYNDWDFIAKYECGRKDPVYVKSCGWQTGFGLKTK